MPGSQLKRLKASLREQGLLGPQQSKKQRKDERAKGNKRLDKKAALEGIRGQFNPFDLKHNVRGPKFQVTSNRPDEFAAKGIFGRPSEAKAVGEEQRRQTLLQDLQRRSKVGGVRDLRFGENDPSMAPEDKMLERFAREKQRNHKKSGMFDLEDEESGAGFGLTHMGQSLSLDGPSLVDDYDPDDLDVSDGGSNDEGTKAYLKRKHLTDGETPGEDVEFDDGQPERKKSKQEVMKELIAKSKFHKYERQAEKDRDEDLREELDQELPNLHALLHGSLRGSKMAAVEDPAVVSAAEKMVLEKAYDLRVRQLAQDRRAQPTERTKTDEERAEDELTRLKELEEMRIRRMQGQDESESGNEAGDISREEYANRPINFVEAEEDDGFGLGKGVKTRLTATELGFDDEDDFIIEDDLIASGSDMSVAESDDEDDEQEGEEKEESAVEVGEDDDEEFTMGFDVDQEQNPFFSNKMNPSPGEPSQQDDPDGLPYVFPCPQTHDELLEITKKIPVEQLPEVVRRIRSLYHPKLHRTNKTKLLFFTKALIQHLPYSCSLPNLPPFSVLESLIRHIHSLAKSFYPVEIGNEFRNHIEQFGRTRPLAPNLGDLVILTAVGTIFPTSDHFHQVFTPAMLLIARYLGQKVPRTLTDYTRGAYLSILALQGQQISKRYVPEVMNFSLNTLCSLAPTKIKMNPRPFPLHEPPSEIRVSNSKNLDVRKLSCLDCVKSDFSAQEAASTKIALINTTIKTLDAAADTWVKSSFLETFQPYSNVLAHLSTKSCKSELPVTLTELIKKSKLKIDRMLNLAQVERRPLELHHHKPLAIKSNIPKFEDSYDPTKHYDPDRERADLSKLKKEHKNERKGAMRELRKDANFMAREKLRVKKSKDAAYEKRYKRLVAEIQGEEGREANAYEREKGMRKKANKRS